MNSTSQSVTVRIAHETKCEKESLSCRDVGVDELGSAGRSSLLAIYSQTHIRKINSFLCKDYNFNGMRVTLHDPRSTPGVNREAAVVRDVQRVKISLEKCM